MLSGVGLCTTVFGVYALGTRPRINQAIPMGYTGDPRAYTRSNMLGAAKGAGRRQLEGTGGASAHRARQHHRCVGCENRGPPRRVRVRSTVYWRSGNRRRGTRRIGAAAASERTASPTRARALVRSTVPSGPASPSAVMPAVVQRRVTRQRNGAATAPKAGACSAMPEASGAVRAAANASATGERQRGGARARREARARTTVPPQHRRRERKRTAPPPERRRGPRCAAVRPPSPGCRAGARGRRGSR